MCGGQTALAVLCHVGESGSARHTQHGYSPLNIADSLLLMMKRAYGMVSGSGMGPPMAARIPNIAPIFLVLPTLDRKRVTGEALGVQQDDRILCRTGIQPARCVNSKKWAPSMRTTWQALAMGMMQDAVELHSCKADAALITSHVPPGSEQASQLTSCP